MSKSLNKLFWFFMVVSAVSFSPKGQGRRILFFGDSITELGVRPGGYIPLLDSMTRRMDLQPPELIGSGVSGDKIYDLYLRVDEDVLARKPDVVVVWVGVNDVWHKRLTGTGTDPLKFERFYRALIKKLKAAGCTVLLCTPAVIGEQKGFVNELDGDLNKYSALIRKIAADAGCPLLDLRREFGDYIDRNNPENRDRGILTTDGVHLNARGNLFVAERMHAVLQRYY